MGTRVAAEAAEGAMLAKPARAMLAKPQRPTLPRMARERIRMVLGRVAAKEPMEQMVAKVPKERVKMDLLVTVAARLPIRVAEKPREELTLTKAAKGRMVLITVQRLGRPRQSQSPNLSRRLQHLAPRPPATQRGPPQCRRHAAQLVAQTERATSRVGWGEPRLPATPASSAGLLTITCEHAPVVPSRAHHRLTLT